MTLRRSNRSRNQTNSYYDDEKKRIEEELLRSAEKNKGGVTDDDEEEDDDGASNSGIDNDSEDEKSRIEEESELEGESPSSSDEDEDFVTNATQKKQSKSPRKAKAKTPSKSKAKNTNTNSLFQSSSMATPMSQSSSTKKNPYKTTPFSRKKRTNLTSTRAQSNKPPNSKTIQNALLLLANRLCSLDSIKHPKAKDKLRKSLFASILNSSPKKKQSSTNPQPQQHSYHENDIYYTQPVSKYTNNLTQIAYDLVKEFNTSNDPNPTTMQVKLLNLLFLSVGGTPNSMLVEECEVQAEEEEDLKRNKHNSKNSIDDDGNVEMEDTGETNSNDESGQVISNLEELDSEDWSEIITTLVEDMRSTPIECIPFSCDPHGALHWQSIQDLIKNATQDKKLVLDVSERDVTVKKGNSSLMLAAKEYRSMYEEFWYILGTVALVEGGMSINQDSDEQEDDDNSVNDSDDEMSSRANKKKRKRSFSAKPKKRAKTNSSITSTTRFDTEIVNGILSKLTELVSFGQPDVRAAATTAALYILHAIVDKTAFIQGRLEVSSRQYAAAVASNKKNKQKHNNASGAKVEALKHQIDSLKRTCDDLEHIIESCFVKTIFMHRYRDSNMYIRASCLHALGRMTVVRPDFFLMDRYLKYFGWMLSDKAECVRNAALTGLLLPFQSHESKQHKKFAERIDLTAMERVLNKFLPRIVDCVIDIHESVQEHGMKLLLALMRNGFLDEAEDKDENAVDLMSDEMWDQVNLKALDSETTASVRKDALYFIMEQLEDFDDGDDENDELDDFDDDSPKRKKKKKNVLSSHLSDRKIAQRLDAIASWAAHTLTAGKVPIDKIRIRLVNHLVYSLRLMQEHKAIVTNWSAMIRAITEDNVAMTSQGTSAGEKADVAKQRVLVQMLICAAQAEVGSVDANFLTIDVDPDVVELLERKITADIVESSTPMKKGNKASSNLQHESLSIALIKTLPNLLVQFKSDSAIIESLVSLPRYFIPSVFSLPQRKSDFILLTKNLTEIFLQSNDEKVLVNSASSLTSLCKGDHARSVEAKTALKKTISELRDRIFVHISVDNRVNYDESVSKEIDKYYALYFNLKRMRVLSKQFDLSKLVGNNEDDSDEMEKLCNFISDGLAHRLTSLKAKDNEGNDESKESKMWKEEDKNLLQITALLIYEGLQFLLSTAAWGVKSMQEENELLLEDKDLLRPMDEESKINVDHFCIRLKDHLVTLVELCFEQYLPEVDNDAYSSAQIEWSDSMQEIGGQIASDIRSLFIKEWCNASSPFLRAAAITEDSRLIAGYIRYFKTKEVHLIHDSDDSRSLLLPLVRSFTSNWKLGNRREASHALRHVAGSGATATDMVETVSRLLKKIEPVRLLEAHMASLRLVYEDWLDNDPEDIMGDNLTQGTDDVTMNEFKELERKRDEQFRNLQSQAQKFSASLGVRKLSDEKLSPGLLGFMQEGIRFSFSGDDDLLLGCRLSFLTVLSKYAHWIKRDKSQLWKLAEFLHEKEIELKKQENEERESTGEDFEGIHEEDLEALVTFRSLLGLKESTLFSADAEESNSVFDSKTPDSSNFERSNEFEDKESRDELSDMGAITQTSSAKAHRSRGSFGSALSKLSSTRGSLSPLYEDAGEVDGGDEEESNSKTSVLSSTGKDTDDASTSSLLSSKKCTIFDPGNHNTSTKSQLTHDSQKTLVEGTQKTQSTFDGEQTDGDMSETG